MQPASPIDRRSDAIVLFYNGGPTPRDVPARDLHGGDLARIAYARAHVDAVGQPKQPTPKQLVELAGDLVGGLEVVPVHGLLEVGRPDVLAGVDVDHGQRLGAVDDQRATGRQVHLAVERLVDLLVDVVALEGGQRIVAVAGELDRQLRL